MKLFEQEMNNPGLLYYIFADPSMVIFSKSLKKLTLREHIYRELKENHFQRIYFINPFMNDIRVEIMDVDSIHGFINEKNQELTYDTFVKDMLSLLDSQEKTAFVMEGGIEGGLCQLSRFLEKTVNFGSFVGVNGYRGKQVIGRIINDNAADYCNKYGHCFLICDSGKASNLVSFFCKESSLFTKYPQIFAELIKILKDEDYRKGKFLLPVLKNELKGRCVCWNNIDKETIHQILLNYLLLEEENVMDFDDALLNDLTEIIYCWYHFWDMRRTAPKLFPSESWKLPESLERNFTKLKRLREDLIKESDGNMEKNLYEMFGKHYIDSDILSIQMDVGQAERLYHLWNQIRHMDMYFEENDKLFDIYISYLRVYRYAIHEDLQDLVKQTVQAMEDSLKKDDRKTFSRCIKILEFCKKYDLQYNQFPAKGIEVCSNMIEISMEIDQQESIIKSNKEEVLNLNKIISTNREKVESFRTRGIAATDARVQIYMENAIDAKNQSKYIENINYRNIRALNLMNDTLAQMELYLQNSSNLENVMDSVQSVREELKNAK